MLKHLRTSRSLVSGRPLSFNSLSVCNCKTQVLLQFSYASMSSDTTPCYCSLTLLPAPYNLSRSSTVRGLIGNEQPQISEQMALACLSCSMQEPLQGFCAFLL
jgi:hypothetical protein